MNNDKKVHFFGFLSNSILCFQHFKDIHVFKIWYFSFCILFVKFRFFYDSQKENYFSLKKCLFITLFFIVLKFVFVLFNMILDLNDCIKMFCCSMYIKHAFFLFLNDNNKLRRLCVFMKFTHSSIAFKRTQIS